MELKQCREDYGWGFHYPCTCPELGDILLVDRKHSEVVYVVIGKNGYDLVTSSICGGDSGIVFFSPLDDVGHYTDFIVIGNILGAAKKSAEREKEADNKYKHRFISADKGPALK